MTTLELKKLLIKRISEIDDIEILKALKIILDHESDAVSLQLTDDIVSEIKESRLQIEKGLQIDSETIDQEFSEWLKEE